MHTGKAIITIRAEIKMKKVERMEKLCGGHHPVGMADSSPVPERGSRWNLHPRKLQVEVIKGPKQNRLKCSRYQKNLRGRSPGIVQKAKLL